MITFQIKNSCKPTSFMLDKYDIPAEKISLVLSCLGVQGRNKCVDLYVLRCWNVLVVAVERDEEVDFAVFQEVIMTSIARRWGTELYSSPSSLHSFPEKMMRSVLGFL